MNTTLPRLTLRLLVPALALGAIATLGEPLPAPPGVESVLLTEIDQAELMLTIEAEARVMRVRAETAKTLHDSAAQMRWFVTLPHSSRRCISDNCSG